MTKEVILYCDESDIRGRYFSNFYGEVKWQKVTSNYLSKYIQLMDLFFSLIREDKIKIRIMFCQNCYAADGLEPYQIEHEYFLLYYQFIKHAFGLRYANSGAHHLNVRAYFDKLPDTKEKCELFKDHIYGLNRYKEFQKARIRINRDQITEVTSHKHDILQCLDIVLGSIQFRLNDKHKEKPEGSNKRGSRTIAKESLYRFINSKIREIYPNFNIGITTGVRGDNANRWHFSYRHWLFMPTNANFVENSTKKK